MGGRRSRSRHLSRFFPRKREVALLQQPCAGIGELLRRHPRRGPSLNAAGRAVVGGLERGPGSGRTPSSQRFMLVMRAASQLSRLISSVLVVSCRVLLLLHNEQRRGHVVDWRARHVWQCVGRVEAHLLVKRRVKWTRIRAPARQKSWQSGLHVLTTAFPVALQSPLRTFFSRFA